MLNLDPNDFDGDEDIADGRFDAIAAQIVDNLATPDVVALQEVQDNNGSDGGGIIAADLTLQTLVDAIVAAGGPWYEFIDNTFIGNNTSGGQPRATSARRTLQPRPGREGRRLVDDQRPEPDRRLLRRTVAAGPGVRVPGNEITIVNNHFSSKGGSAPRDGTARTPPSARRTRRSTAVLTNVRSSRRR